MVLCTQLQIDLRGNIVIIDEAHNIEDICRDAASCTITRTQILEAIKVSTTTHYFLTRMNYQFGLRK